jgi:hypothetical protein
MRLPWQYQKWTLVRSTQSFTPAVVTLLLVQEAQNKSLHVQGPFVAREGPDEASNVYSGGMYSMCILARSGWSCWATVWHNAICMLRYIRWADVVRGTRVKQGQARKCPVFAPDLCTQSEFSNSVSAAEFSEVFGGRTRRSRSEIVSHGSLWEIKSNHVELKFLNYWKHN